MATQAQPKEQPHEYLTFKEFRGVDTQPSRTALPKERQHWIENMMPIGDSYAPAVPAPDTATATLSSSVSTFQQITIGTVDYMLTFLANGGCEAVNLADGSITTVCTASTFVSAVADQWKSERAVIVDSTNGYFSWDVTAFYSPGSLATISVTAGGSGYTSAPTVGFSGGGGTGATATASINGGGVSGVFITAVGSGYTTAPSVTFTGGGGTVTATASAFMMPTGFNGSAVAVYSGRVWIANGRLLSYTAPSTWFDMNTADAAGSTTITEGYLRNKIYWLTALDNYLYLFADGSIFIIGDLKVTGSITTYSFTNLSSTTGTTLPRTVTSMERAILFTNKYGVYATFGASVQKISEGLDGVFPDIDFTSNVSAGLATIYNILCYVLSFTYKDPVAGNRTLQAVYFGGKWFFTSQGNSIAFIAPVQIAGSQSVFASSGTDLTKLYQNTTNSVATTFTTALVPEDSPILDKQFIRYGVEFSGPALTTVTVELQTEIGSEYLVATAANAISWINISNQTVYWTNSSTQSVAWISTGFVMANGYADLVGKYLGYTVTSINPGFTLHGMLGEYVVRAPW